MTSASGAELKDTSPLHAKRAQNVFSASLQEAKETTFWALEHARPLKRPWTKQSPGPDEDPSGEHASKLAGWLSHRGVFGLKSWPKLFGL